ncbi:hypothetical protein POSPLADRAFT_1155310, partial [Postia placenta MAD-698-R-SB12]
ACKLGRASSRGLEAPIVVYNDPARSRGQTRSLCRCTGCSNTIASARLGVYYLAKLWGQLEARCSLRWCECRDLGSSDRGKTKCWGRLTYLTEAMVS